MARSSWDHLQSALSGHAQIDEHQVRAAIASKLQSLFAVRGRLGFPMSLRQRPAESIAKHLVIVNDERQRQIFRLAACALCLDE